MPRPRGLSCLSLMFLNAQNTGQCLNLCGAVGKMCCGGFSTLGGRLESVLGLSPCPLRWSLLPFGSSFPQARGKPLQAYPNLMCHQPQVRAAVLGRGTGYAASSSFCPPAVASPALVCTGVLAWSTPGSQYPWEIRGWLVLWALLAP